MRKRWQPLQVSLLVAKVMSGVSIGAQRTIVEITTQSQQTTRYRVTTTTALTDASGSPLPVRTVDFDGIAGPGLFKATATDATHLTLTFTGPVGDSALAASTYKIDKLDGQGVAIATLAINGAAFVGDQRTVVELKTQSQQSARYRIATTNALTDFSGSLLPIRTVEFDGITGQPTLALVASTGPTTVLVTFSAPMSDTVLSVASYAISKTSDSSAKLQVLR